MLPKSLIMNPGLILYYCVVVVVKFGFGRLGGMGGWLVSASKVTHVIGFRAKGVSPDILQFTKHQQPHHYRRHVSQLCCVLNNCILSSLIDGQSPVEAGVSRQHCRLLGRTCCEISCLSPWYRLAALPHRGRSELFPHYHFVPIQSNQRY
jgi:hypothetical protein